MINCKWIAYKAVIINNNGILKVNEIDYSEKLFETYSKVHAEELSKNLNTSFVVERVSFSPNLKRKLKEYYNSFKYIEDFGKLIKSLEQND